MSCQDTNLNTGGKEILIVDDNKFLIDGLEQLLKRKGYQVSTATNGREALKAMEERRINLMITDVNMPEMDGIRLIRDIIRRNFNEVAVIMISAINRFEELPEDIKNRVFACLNKWDISKIIFEVERSFRIFSPQKE